MRLSNSERLLESLPPEPRKPEKYVIKDIRCTRLAEINSDAVQRMMQSVFECPSEEQLLAAMEDMQKEWQEQQRLLDLAFLRTVCKKYVALTGTTVDLTHGIPDDFREVYDSVVYEVYAQMRLMPSEDIWKMAARLTADDWGKI